jgi:hypothetical protein
MKNKHAGKSLAETALTNLTDAQVARGQAAWSRIKATAAEQRELWRDVGAALLVGRKLHPSNQKFSQWCKEHCFDMAAPVRSDAIWFAESYTACKNVFKVSRAYEKLGG